MSHVFIGWDLDENVLCVSDVPCTYSAKCSINVSLLSKHFWRLFTANLKLFKIHQMHIYIAFLLQEKKKDKLLESTKSFFRSENLNVCVTVSVFNFNIEEFWDEFFSLIFVCKCTYTHTCMHISLWVLSALPLICSLYTSIPHSAILFQFGEQFIWNFI